MVILEKFLDLGRKIIPRKVFTFFQPYYHKLLVFLAALVYGFPSEKLIVIGVTGTNGKTTTCNLIARILEESGYGVAMATTANFRLAGREWINETKMTMLGRFQLQKFLRRAVVAGCRYAVVETSSQGIDQYRHLGINYDVAVFTNLRPEHIEAHGGFENYKRAKGRLFLKLGRDKRKVLAGKKVKKISVLNLDDMAISYFWQFPADQKFGYGIDKESRLENLAHRLIVPEKIDLKEEGASLEIMGTKIDLKLPGLFNIYNSLAAISVALSQGISLGVIKNAFQKFDGAPGRMEKIIASPKQDFAVYVDYAHDPGGLEAVYRTAKAHLKGRLISVLSSAGGGRDKWKRPELGQLADEFADIVILTNEDPYDEEPEEIIRQIKAGIQNKITGESLFEIIDRQEAIRKAIGLAKAGDIILLTGKGAEQCIMGPGGQRIPWDERRVAKEELKRRFKI